MHGSNRGNTLSGIAPLCLGFMIIGAVAPGLQDDANGTEAMRMNAKGEARENSDSISDYVATLLLNEVPFPGERGWNSEADSKAAMLQILWVLESRLNHVPKGYTQQEIASQRCKDIIDVITAGGEKGQCDGFYRNDAGRPISAPRVLERIDYLTKCANQGPPGKFARLLDYANSLAGTYVKQGALEADRFAQLTNIGKIKVTGRAYSWMTDHGGHHPGGSFVKIPDSETGVLGGNRFFTLRSKP